MIFRKFLLFFLLFFILKYSIFSSEKNLPFIKIRELSILTENREIIEYATRINYAVDLVDGEIIEKYLDKDCSGDIGVYIKNKYNKNIYFNNYDKRNVYLYDEKKKEVDFLDTMANIIMIGVSEDKGYMYVFEISNPLVYTISRLRMSDVKNKFWDKDQRVGKYFETVISSATGLPEEVVCRLYYIKYAVNNKFVLTVAMDEKVNFLPDFFGLGKPVVPKESLYPIPEKSREPLPCDIYELSVKGPIPVGEGQESDFELKRLALDLSSYGVAGELEVDSLFKIHQLVDYSKSLKKYAFIGRVYKNKYKKDFIDYLFLVNEAGGKPEPVIEMKKGKDIEDMIFSPKGDQLVLDIDSMIYILDL